LYLARARADVVALFDAFAARTDGDDQAAFNAVLCDRPAGGDRVGAAACRAASGVVAVTLPADAYATGARHWTDGGGHDRRLWYHPRAALAAQCASMRGDVAPGVAAAAVAAAANAGAAAAAAASAPARVTLHNNHIWPGELKAPRFVTQGMWFFDAPAAAAAAAAAGLGPAPARPPPDGGGGASAPAPAEGVGGEDPPAASLFATGTAPAAGGYCASTPAPATAASTAACGNYCNGLEGERRRRRRR